MARAPLQQSSRNSCDLWVDGKVPITSNWQLVLAHILISNCRGFDFFSFLLLFLWFHCRAKLELMDERSSAGKIAGCLFCPQKQLHTGTQCCAESSSRIVY